ncbi:MAG: MAPEG family protein [Povalibacter sp.]|jgi:glutathione S-transferase
MHYVAIVSVLALLEFLILGFLVAIARGKYGVAAPAVSGHEMFERHFRIHMNTLEQLVVFLPAMWICTRYFDPTWVAALGSLFVIGRIVYAVSYFRDPRKRTMGFVLTSLPVMAYLVIILYGAIGRLVLAG